MGRSLSRAPALSVNLICDPMTEERDNVAGEEASLLLLDVAFELAAADCVFALVDGPPADDEEALEAALPLRLCAFEKLREFGWWC